jgi:hypothetical protein
LEPNERKHCQVLSLHRSSRARLKQLTEQIDYRSADEYVEDQVKGRNDNRIKIRLRVTIKDRVLGLELFFVFPFVRSSITKIRLLNSQRTLIDSCRCHHFANVAQHELYKFVLAHFNYCEAW